MRAASDMTALRSKRLRRDVVENVPRNCVSVVLAINEGILLDLARSQPDSSFAQAVHLLHEGQRGIRNPYEPEAPVVIDVGGYDPVENGVIERLLDLPLLKELVDATDCACESPLICPRRLAWQLFESKDVRSRVNELVRLVGLRGHPVLFRDLWDFVADLALGGSCEDDPPTSPWFWRVFHGTSSVSRDVRSVADPDVVVFPRAEAHIWYGDLYSPEISLLAATQLVPIGDGSSLSINEHRWMKSQLFFLVDSSSALDVLRGQVDFQLLRAVSSNRTHEIVGALNRYMSYDTVLASQAVLDLWTDLGVERRTDRTRGQVSLGTICSRRPEAMALARRYQSPQ